MKRSGVTQRLENSNQWAARRVWVRWVWRVVGRLAGLGLVAILAQALAQGPPEILWQASGHSREINAVAYNPDGTLIASASDDFTIKLWRRDTGALVRTLWGHAEDVQSVYFTPDGKQVVSGGKDNTIRVWQVEDGVQVRQFEEKGSLAGYKTVLPRHAMALAPDGKTVAVGRTFADASSGKAVAVIQVRQLNDGRVAHEWVRPDREVLSLAFSPDGASLADGEIRYSGAGSCCALWRLADGAAMTNFVWFTNRVECVAFSPDGQSLAAASVEDVAPLQPQEHTIYLLATADGALVRALPQGSYASVRSLAFSPDGQTLATASFDGTLRLWDNATGGGRWTNLWTSAARAVAFSPDGRELAAGNKGDQVAQFDAADGRLMRYLTAHADPVREVVFSHDETTLASCAGDADDHSIRLWNARDGSLAWLTRHVFPSQLEFAPDDRALCALAAVPDNSASVYWPGTSRPPLTLWMGQTAVAWWPDGDRLALAGQDWSVGLYPSESAAAPRYVPTFAGTLRELSPLPDGKRLLACSAESKTRLLSLPEGKVQRVFPGAFFALSPDGAQVATRAPTADDLSIWNLETGALVRRLQLGFDASVFLAFTPDWSAVVTRGAGSLRFWRVSDDTLLQSFDEQVEKVTTLAFSGSGQLMAYGKKDGSVTVARNRLGLARWVGAAPAFTVEPQGQSAASGQPVRLWGKAEGALPLSYQWWKEGAPLAGMTNAALAFDPLTLGDAGSYVLVASNALGKATSVVATLAVTDPPVFTKAPVGQTALVGGQLTFQAELAGSGPFSYQWHCDGREVPGATNTVLNLNAAGPNDSGAYSVVVTQPGGAVESAPVPGVVQEAFLPKWRALGGWWHNAPEAVVFSPDGAQVYTVAQFSDSFCVERRRVADGVLQAWQILAGQHAVISPDGRWVAAVGTDNWVSLRRLEDFQETERIWLSWSQLSSLVFSPDGARLAGAFAGGTYVRGIGSPTNLVALQAAFDAGASMAFVPGGSWFAGTTTEGALGFWDTATGAWVNTLPLDLYQHAELAFSSDGQLLAVGGDDRRVRLCRVADGAVLHEFSVGQRVRRLAFSADQRVLLVCSSGLSLFRVADGKPLYLDNEWLAPVSYDRECNAVFSLAADLLGYAAAGDIAVFANPFAPLGQTPTLRLAGAGAERSLALEGLAPRRYTLQASPDLYVWRNVTNLVPAGTNATLALPAPGEPSQYFRLLAP